MDPTYQGLPPQYPTSRPRRGGISKRFLLFILGGIAVVIIGVILLVSGQDQTKPLQSRLTARLATLGRMIDEGDKNLKDPDLRKLNTDISIQVLSDTTSISAALKKVGAKKPDKALTAAEADQASFTTLKNAALNNRFDSAYSKTLAQKLDSTAALIRELYDKSTNKDLRATLSDAYTHFKHLETQLSSDTSS